MPKFSLQQKMPSCLVSKELLSSIEAYLKSELPTKFGESLGDETDYRISIKEKIGTETLVGITDCSSGTFSDGTTAIEMRWSNGYQAATRLEILVDFDREYYLSKVRVECTGPIAREMAKGVAESILRLVDSHRTQNWLFNPFQVPVTASMSGLAAFVLLYFGVAGVIIGEARALYAIAGAAFMVWVCFSAQYFRPYTSFDTRRQRLLNRVWLWFSLGVLGFVVFGTLLPTLRKGLFGF
jgi:hypothetical protein